MRPVVKRVGVSAWVLGAVLSTGLTGCRKLPQPGGSCRTDVDCVSDERCVAQVCSPRPALTVPTRPPAARPADPPPREPLRRAMDPRYQRSGNQGAQGEPDGSTLMPAVPPPPKKTAPEHQRTFLPNG